MIPDGMNIPSCRAERVIPRVVLVFEPGVLWEEHMKATLIALADTDAASTANLSLDAQAQGEIVFVGNGDADDPWWQEFKQAVTEASDALGETVVFRDVPAESDLKQTAQGIVEENENSLIIAMADLAQNLDQQTQDRQSGKVVPLVPSPSDKR